MTNKSPENTSLAIATLGDNVSQTSLALGIRDGHPGAIYQINSLLYDKYEELKTMRKEALTSHQLACLHELSDYFGTSAMQGLVHEGGQPNKNINQHRVSSSSILGSGERD